ncbi:ArsR/SmtB family transcription factor [Agromyces kandeliae]|uniref:Helix-turn-helix domain-containing protein n=1 Tax=Agromyces kandeliae TaxID=2666141 RepID=A0A6L5R1Q6_9MICO|nr:helix-turn-helix transcriptional regulator [Agromyces kandeliae]MRX43963.1 helix-turn-helix domain-containing protein [Agromyces kandeliae]
MVYSAGGSGPRAPVGVGVDHDADAARLDAVFAALSHRSRRDLVVYLAARADSPRMSQVAVDRGVSPQLLNKHTAALEKAGLVRRVGDGRERRLVLDTVALAEAQQWIGRAREYWTARLDALDSYIANLEDDSDA